MSLLTARLFYSGSILLSLLIAVGAHAQRPRIAVIIDDVGNQLSAGRRAAALPGPVAIAVLPHTPFAATLAEQAHASGKEVIVHMPMQSSSADVQPGPGALLLGDSRAQLAANVTAAVNAVPHATGLSNHMGSLLTRDPSAMSVVMNTLEDIGGLFFVDSYTTHLSVALMSARERGIDALKRDVFIDTDQTPAAIEAAFEQLLERAEQQGFAVGIAHPYPQTLDLLERRLPQLEDVELVPLRTLIGDAPRQRSYAEQIGAVPIAEFIGVTVH